MSTVPEKSDAAFKSPLATQLGEFLAQKHAMGYRYREEGRALRQLDRFLITRLSLEDPLITMAIVQDYVARRGTESESTRAHRLTLIREFCRFLHLEDARTVVPERRSLRITRQRFVARVLSRDEGKIFLQACAKLATGRISPARDVVLGTALRLLYLAGLRAGELLQLTQADVDLDGGLLHIRHTKFGKSRVIPIAPSLVQHMLSCRALGTRHFGSCLPLHPFFFSPRGKRYSITALREAFRQTLKAAGIERVSGKRRIRLHDLRHSFAVLRLLLWCEQNADLGAKLPLLAAYLGHTGLVSSQRYLQLTQDLMGEITRRHQARFGYLINEGRV
jgi:integrase